VAVVRGAVPEDLSARGSSGYVKHAPRWLCAKLLLRQFDEFVHQLFRGFNEIRVVRDAVDRANLLALRFIVVADAFSALVRIDFVNFIALRDGIVRAFGFAYIAVDAVVGDHQSHGFSFG
jgi:hypothetical protein